MAPAATCPPGDTQFQPGDFDLRRFAVLVDGEDVLFEVTLGADIRVPQDLYRLNSTPARLWNNLYLQNIDIYVDTDPTSSAGHTACVPGRRVAFAEGRTWKRAVILTPQPGLAQAVMADALPAAPKSDDLPGSPPAARPHPHRPHPRRPAGRAPHPGLGLLGPRLRRHLGAEPQGPRPAHRHGRGRRLHHAHPLDARGLGLRRRARRRRLPPGGGRAPAARRGPARGARLLPGGERRLGPGALRLRPAARRGRLRPAPRPTRRRRRRRGPTSRWSTSPAPWSRWAGR